MMKFRTLAACRILALAVAAAVPLAACTSTGGGQRSVIASTPPADPGLGSTNAPVGGGVDVQPGSEEDFMVNVGRRTFFAESSSKLDETAIETLDKQAAWMLQHPQWKVKIQGFADDPGNEKQNLALSSKRAEAVMNYLVSKGVPPDRLQAKGYGRDRERLVLNCTDISCKAQNRRVISNPQEDGQF